MNKFIKFEILKITRKRTTKVIVVFSLAIILYLFGGISLQEKVVDEHGQEHKGLEAISMQKEWDAKLAGKMTDDRITKAIMIYQEEFNNPENVVIAEDGKTMIFKEQVCRRFVYPRKEYYTLISENYDPPLVYGGISNLSTISLDDSRGFYETRDEKVNKILDKEYLDANYTAVEKEFWKDMNEKVEKPFTYGYAKGWIYLIQSADLWFFVILAVCICIAPVFAEEYQSGMDSLIFTAKYGKSKVITAKVLASFIYGTGIFLLNSILAIAVVLFPYGIDGWNLPVQIMETVIPYPINFLEAVLIYILIAYLITVAFIMLNLVLSAIMNSPYPVLIIDALLLIIPMFMIYSETNYVYNHIFPLLPTKAVGMSLSYFIDFKFGTVVIAWPSMIMICYFVITILLLPLVYYIFKRRQVK